MKKFTLLLIALILTLGLDAQVPLLKGHGTSESPYLIASVDGLKFMRDKVNIKDTVFSNKYFKLISDLDFKEMGDWIPIGNEYSSPFIGIFDGNGKVIRHIKIGSQGNYTSVPYAGLFGYAEKAIINNLGVEWDGMFVSVTSECSMAGVGGIVGGIYNGTIINCYSSGVIYANSKECSYVGGISGRTDGSRIINCFSNCSISSSSSSSSSDSNCGGITGLFYSGTIENCCAVGSVSVNANSSFAGGIAGSSILVMGLPYISDCIALNDTIIAIGPIVGNNKSPFVSRISSEVGNCRFGTNYASQKMILKYGDSVGKLKLLNNFKGIENGESLVPNLIAHNPLILLNNWVSKNSLEYKGIYSLKTWKTANDLNHGFPVFSDFISKK